MRVQPLTKSTAKTYTGNKTVKEDVKVGTEETAPDVGGIRGAGREVGAVEPDGTGGTDSSGTDGEVSGAGSVFDSDAGSSGEGTDADRGGVHDGIIPPITDIAGEIRAAHPNASADIESWTDAPPTQLGKQEAEAFSSALARAKQLAGGRHLSAEHEESWRCVGAPERVESGGRVHHDQRAPVNPCRGMRSRLSEVVKNEFLLWLSQNTTSTDREADKVSKETKRYIKALLDW